MKKSLKKILASSVVSVAMVCAATSASAIPINQYASSVIGFSSQYSPTSWGAIQALGAPNVPTYSDHPNAWAPSVNVGTNEFLSLGFATAVYATGATITESFSPGFVTQVDVIDMLGVLHTVWTGIDTSPYGVIANFNISWVQTGYLVQGIKIYVNNQVASWKEIDAVLLSGQAAQAIPVPNPATLALLSLGIIGFVATRRRMI